MTEALEQRVSNLQMENARANGLIAELKGRLDATESDVKESRAQAMRVKPPRRWPPSPPGTPSIRSSSGSA